MQDEHRGEGWLPFSFAPDQVGNWFPLSLTKTQIVGMSFKTVLFPCPFIVLLVFLPEPRRSSPLGQILRGYWLS